MRPIDANLLSGELEKMELLSNEINISEYQFEPYTNYTIATNYTIDTSLPRRRYGQCKHCSAPGQVIGGFCEYCEQVVNE